MTRRSVPVVIAGAGPTGLTTAIELGRSGIRSVVLEQNDGVGYNPRAKLTNVRSMEHLRRWGIAERLRAANPMPPGFGAKVVFATRMNGFTLAEIDGALNIATARDELYSEPATWVPQYTLEAVLRDYALELGTVDLRFSTRFLSANEGPDGVTVLCEEADGSRTTIDCDYLVGADGAKSAVRKQLNVRMSGTHAFARNYNVLFRAAGLRALHRKPAAIQYWLINEDVPSLMGPMDDDDLWYIIATRIGDETDFDRIDPHELINRAVGEPIDVTVVSTDPWVAHLLVADSYGTRRILLAGDACHLHPPFGGFGMNLGIGDGVDLGWKLAAVIEGWGGPALLGSFERERKPVHVQTMNEAMANYAVVGNQLMRDHLEDLGPEGDANRATLGADILRLKEREFRSLGIVLGYRYAESSTVVPDGTRAPEYNLSRYEPSATPGSLAPHRWLTDGSSLYDHFGAGFTLLLRGTAPEPIAFTRAAATRGVPLTVLRMADSVVAQRYETRYVLVRPDQHVAWRSDDISDPNAILDRVCGFVPESEGKPNPGLVRMN